MEKRLGVWGEKGEGLKKEHFLLDPGRLVPVYKEKPKRGPD
jgi:hypothetical protein